MLKAIKDQTLRYGTSNLDINQFHGLQVASK